MSVVNQETANQETQPPLANPAQEAQHEPDIVFPPSDLYSNEPPLETELHLRQIILLITCLEWLWRDRNDFYASGNLTSTRPNIFGSIRIRWNSKALN
jgi:Uma2 family endonuclease